MKGKTEKIKDAIQEVTGNRPQFADLKTPSQNQNYGTSYINDVLLFSSSYDYFLIQEDGRLDTLIEERFSIDGVRRSPQLSQVETKKGCEQRLENQDMDLLIVFNDPTRGKFEDFVESVKKDHPDLPIVWLTDDDLDVNKSINIRSQIEKIFTWNGDGKIILTIIQHIEDKFCYLEGDFDRGGRPLLLVEDSEQFYSSYLSQIYEKIWANIDDILHEDLTRAEKMKRYRRRPYVVAVEETKGAREVYENLKDDLLCLITDNRIEDGNDIYKNAGLEFAEEVRSEDSEIPILLQSSSPLKDKLEEKGLDKIRYIEKTSPELNQKISEFVEENLGSTTLVVNEGEGFEEYEIKTIDDLEQKMDSLDKKTISRLIESGELASWFETRTEFEIANKIKEVRTKNNSFRAIEEELMNAVEEYRYSSYETAVTDFDREPRDPKSKINRIGDGALGGKARGLAFVSKLFSRYLDEDLFEDLRITVPRTIVLSTEVFDKFIEENDLFDQELLELSDQRIASKFIDADLPATVIGDIRSFIRDTRNPMIVRSSGLLEDSLTQPFAGVYSSMLLPNESWETSLRFKEVCNAIKYVYSSTFFEAARNYLKSTPKNLGDEKMSVILQEVVGEKHENFFYPKISGVAKSYNHYPSQGCDPEDGIVYLALGLGKEIVEGGSSYFFCPEHPKSPMFGTPKDFIGNSQRKFFALNLESIYRIVKKDEESALSELDIDKAEEHGVLDKLASTYSPRDDRLYPGIHREGSRVLNFAPIINYNAFPLADAIKLLLDVTEIALGYPVEIEFAVEFDEEDEEPAELVVLQIRSMASGEEYLDVDVEECDDRYMLCSSDDALGNAVMKEIKDVVYTKPDSFELRNSERAVEQIRKINDELMEEDRDYILIGPGRWGTTDHWMGIPVEWGDICGAKVIIETPAEGRTIEPSQGSHFFHDMISTDTSYLIVDDGAKGIDWDWLEDQPVENEKQDIKHVRLEEPVEVRVDGKKGKGLITKKIQKALDTNIKEKKPNIGNKSEVNDHG